MAFHIAESFEVQAPLEEVWDFLIDPQRVVRCLPGAEVTDVIDEKTYNGRVTVKVGPVTAKYKGTVRLEEADEEQHRVRLQGEGKETGGSGSARMSMTGRILAAGEGKSRVEVDTEIDVAGKMARFGRGVMEDVSRQLFREFAKNTQERFARERSAQPGGKAIDEDDAAPTEASPIGDSDGETRRSAPAAGEKRADATSDSAQPLSLVTLVYRTVRSRVVRLFGG